jgi:AcrR family transcriptional regulator
MWISKEGDVRKREFLNAALKVFCEKGYDNATINDILAKVKVTKGSFYYYFKSMEDVLKELASAQVDDRIRILEGICDTPDIGALEKMNRIIREMYEIRIQSAGILLRNQQMLQKEENARLASRILEQVLERAKTLYEKIIRQGIDEKVFTTAFPGEAAEMYIYLVNRLRDSIVKLLTRSCDEIALKEKVLFYQSLINGMLGAKDEGVDLFGPVFRLIQAVNSSYENK